ncbi:MAG TPA: hypothetical protein VJS64_13480, partial [Pyrinomonadaceae bacterium]|nr:hypothetical protein [Pyrinomonadaceae bacterium]
MKTPLSQSRRLDILGDGDRSSERDVLATLLRQCRQKLRYFSIFAAIPAMLGLQIPEARADETKKPERNVAGEGVRFFAGLSPRYSNPVLLQRQSAFRLPHQKGNFTMTAAFAGNDNCPGRAIPGGSYTAAAPYLDSGDTTGANDTVTRAGSFYYCYYSYNAFGPDHVYSFTLTGRGPNPQITVATTSGSYSPLIYVLRGGNSGSCPVGTGTFPCGLMVMSPPASPGGTALLDAQRINALPLNVPLHLFVDSAINSAGPYTLRLQDVTIAPAGCPNNPID